MVPFRKNLFKIRVIFNQNFLSSDLIKVLQPLPFSVICQKSKRKKTLFRKWTTFSFTPKWLTRSSRMLRQWLGQKVKEKNSRRREGDRSKTYSIQSCWTFSTIYTVLFFTKSSFNYCLRIEKLEKKGFFSSQKK